MKHRFILAMVILNMLNSGIVYSSEVVLTDKDDGLEQDKTNSRFKIFTAEHEAVLRDGKVVKVRSIFKIDLETGTVWRYRQGVDSKGKQYEEFFEIPNQ
jgi:hypothetical protein